MYLLSAEINGVKNIDKKVKLSFYKQTIDKTFDMSNYRIKAIFGENGCGKTALITAFSIVRDILLDGRYLNVKQDLLEKIINKKTQRYEFSCEFICCEDKGNIVYNYSISLNHNESGYYIEKEQFSKKNGNYANSNYKDIYVVNNGELVLFATDKETENELRKNTLNILREKTFLSIFLSNTNQKFKLLEGVLDMLRLLLFWYNTSVYIGDTDKHDLYMLYNEIGNKFLSSEGLDEDTISDMLSRITNTSEDMVRIELYGVYEKKIERMSRFIKLFKPDLQSIDIQNDIAGDFYRCRLIFNYHNYTVDREFESTGIKKLMSVFDAIDFACRGGIVFIDEFDANINAIYLEKIIEYIIIYGTGQLCFSTHGLEIMDLLKNEKLAIDFLTKNQEIVHWTAKGNASPINYYKKGFIEGIPYNIDSVDLLDIFMENDE